MKVRFLEDISGSVDGFNSIKYHKGQEVIVDEIKLNSYLADAWLKKGIIEEIKENIKIDKVKAIEKAPENKAIEFAPENKTIEYKKPKKHK